MILDPYKSIFLIPLKDKKYAQFRFKPTCLMEGLLNEYKIPYEKKNKRFIGKKLVESCQQKVTLYKVESQHNKDYIFLFSSDIIDQVLDYYKVSYTKGGPYGEKRNMP